MTSLGILNSEGKEVEQVISGQDITLAIKYKIPSGKCINQGVCMVFIKDTMGQPIFSLNTRIFNDYLPQLQPDGTIYCDIPNIPLNEGSYYIDISIKQGPDSRALLDGLDQAGVLNIIGGDFYKTGKIANKQNSPVLVNHKWYIFPVGNIS
jgi:hypothetical protein